MSNLENLALETLIERLADRTSATRKSEVLDLRTEIGARLNTLREAASKDIGVDDVVVFEVLDGKRMSFAKLLDAIMEEMDAAGVASTQAMSLEDAEDEPHRSRAWELREALNDRFELLQAANAHAARIMDGG